jgi:phosphoribosylanthranilate isomerase
MNDSMFRIKICGLTRIDDARVAIDAGADAIGLNFVAGSPRAVPVELATEISAVLPHSVVSVGVFVNSPAAEIVDIAAAVGLGWVQLHGDEPPEALAELPAHLKVLRAFRLQAGDARPIGAFVDASRAAGRLPDGVLVDAFDPAQYGGTGKTLPWGILRGEPVNLGLPLVLAGGLTPTNVAQAITAAGAAVAAVDTASGVEAAPGIKDPQLVRAFVAAAATALERRPR